MISSGILNAQSCNTILMATQDSVGCQIIFQDLSGGNPNVWKWSFGDNQFSTLQNCTHNYAGPGVYTVGLKIKNTNTGCTDSAFGQINVVCFPTYSVTIIKNDKMNLINFPNPFAENTTITYSLPDAAHVLIEVFDMFGKKIDVLADEDQSGGEHSGLWNAEAFPEGIYLLRITAGDNYSAKRLLVKN